MPQSFLVTGASGFSGSHMLDYLVAHEPQAKIVAMSSHRDTSRPDIIGCRADVSDLSATPPARCSRCTLIPSRRDHEVHSYVSFNGCCFLCDVVRHVVRHNHNKSTLCLSRVLQ